MRLYNRGDSISNAVKNRRLKREYTHTSELTSFIFWTDVGPEGAFEFEEQMRHKKMAEELVDAYGDTISVEKAQRMIRKSVEAQKKANAVRGSVMKFRNNPRTPPFQTAGARRSQPNNRSNRYAKGPSRATRRTAQSAPRRNSATKGAQRRRRP